MRKSKEVVAVTDGATGNRILRYKQSGKKLSIKESVKYSVVFLAKHSPEILSKYGTRYITKTYERFYRG